MLNSRKSDSTIFNTGKFLAFLFDLILITVYAVLDHFLIGVLSLALSAVFMLDFVYSFPVLLFYSFLDHDISAIFGHFPIEFLMMGFIFALFLNVITHKRAMFTANHLVIIFVILLTYISAVINNSTGSFYFRDFMMLLLIMFLISEARVEAEKLVDLTLISAVFAVIYFIINNLINPIDISLSRYELTTGVNINAISFVCMNVFCILTTYAINTPNKFVKIALLGAGIFIIYLLIAYSSRTAIFSCFLTFAFASIIYARSNDRAFKTMLKIFLVATVVVCFVLSLNWNSEQIERLSLDSIKSDQASNRKYIWDSLAKSVIPNNILFGIGMEPASMRFALKTADCVVVSSYAHNFFLGLFAQCGLPCGVLILTIMVNALRGIKRVIFDGKAIVIFSIVLSSMLMGIGESTCFYRTLWFGLATFSLYYNSVEDRENYA